MKDSEQIARYFSEIHSGGTEGFDALCRAYYDKLAAIARHRFGNFPRRVTDEYAVANSVLQEFHDRARRREYVGVQDPAELLAILARLTRDRVVDEIRRYSAEKRGGGKTRGHSIFAPIGGEPVIRDFDRFQSVEDTPSTKEIIVEEMQQLLRKLADPELRTILVLRYEGLTNQEIAEQLQVSVATVERKRRRIRECLADQYPAVEEKKL